MYTIILYYASTTIALLGLFNNKILLPIVTKIGVAQFILTALGYLLFWVLFPIHPENSGTWTEQSANEFYKDYLNLWSDSLMISSFIGMTLSLIGSIKSKTNFQLGVILSFLIISLALIILRILSFNYII